MVITSKAWPRSHLAHSLFPPFLGSLGAHTAPFHAHSCMVLVLRTHEVAVEHRSDHLGNDRVLAADSRPLADRGVADHSGHRADRRSSCVVVAYGGDSPHGAGCSLAVDHDGHNIRLVVVHRSRDHDSPESGNDSARVGEERRFGACKS